MTLDEFLQEQKKLNGVMKSQGKEMISNLLKEMLGPDSPLESIVWSQGTPSFNDGEPCLFSRSYPSFTLKEIPPDKMHRMRRDDDGTGQERFLLYVDEWELKDVLSTSDYEKILPYLRKLYEIDVSCIDLYRVSFGDGYTIRATATSIDITRCNRCSSY